MLEELLIEASLIWEAPSVPHWTHQKGELMIPALLELPFLFTTNPGPWEKWERGLVTGLSLDIEKINSASIPFPPNLPFVPQFDD